MNPHSLDKALYNRLRFDFQKLQSQVSKGVQRKINIVNERFAE